MIEQEFVKSLNILYVEDDANVREALSYSLEKLFNNIFVTTNGLEAKEVYEKIKEKNIRLDAIISDISMESMDGITLLEYIRNDNGDIPFIFTSAYSEVEYLMSAIKLGATDYLLKPIELNELVEKIGKECKIYNKNRMIKRQKKELERYLRAIDNVAIISKTDLKGNITFANDIFCEIAQYTREELYGNPHNIVRHPDMPSKAFEDLWETIKSGHTWQGKVKNKAKDGSAYYVNATIIPLMDDLNEEIIEYMGIRFLTTDEELEKREFKKRVLQNIKDTKQKQLADAKQIQLLERKLKNYSNVGLLEDALNNEKKKSQKLNTQLAHYETEMKFIKRKKEDLIESANNKVKEASNVATQLKGLNTKLTQETSTLKEELYEKEEMLQNLTIRVENQSKVIRDLRDVIAYREQQLESMKS